MHTTLKCQLATTPQTLDEVYRLRYTCYRRKLSIDPRADERFEDAFDRLPNSFSFLVHDRLQAALATVRITVVKPAVGWTDSPASHVYGDHPAFESIAGESFVEASRLCFGEQARRDSFVKLLGYMAAMAEFFDVAWLVACPRVEHAETYQRMFGFRPLAPARQYYGVKFETQLLGIRVGEIRNYVAEMRPMSRAWSDALEDLIRTERLGARPEHQAPVWQDVTDYPALCSYQM